MFGIPFSIISSVVGAIFGGVQNSVAKYQDSKAELAMRKLELESQERIANIQSSGNITQSNNDVQISDNNRVSDILKSESSAYSDFTKAVVETSSYQEEGTEYRLVRLQNFIVCTARPILTYLMLALVSVMAIILTIKGNVDLLQLFDLVLSEFTGMIAYWFITRTYDKRNLSFKKKV